MLLGIDTAIYGKDLVPHLFTVFHKSGDSMGDGVLAECAHQDKFAI